MTSPARWWRSAAGSFGIQASLLGAAVALLTKFRLTEGNARIAVGGPYDDLWYVDHARSLVDGRWLGGYNNLTLIKGPFYPLFIAAVHQLHVPLFVGESLLYAIACGVVVLAIAPLVRAAALRLAVFIVLLFNPFTFDATTDRVIRGDIMPSLTLLVVGLSIWIFLRRERKPVQLIVPAAALGAALGAFFLTREEGVWMAAFIVPMAIATVVVSPPERAAFLERTIPIAVATLVALSCSFAVAASNDAHYGWFATVEITTPEFTSAYGALTRIVPPESAHADPRIPVSAGALEAAYRVSPAARELQPSFARSYPIAMLASCEQLRICGGISGGWFLWIFRDAVAESGHYASGAEARRFYRAFASEIDAACAARTLTCTRNTRSLAPPVPLSAAPRIALDAVRASAPLLAFSYLNFDRSARSDPAVVDLFRIVTGDRIAAVDGSDRAPVPPAAGAIGTVYQRVTPLLAALAGLALVVRLVVWWRRKRFDPASFIALCIVAASATLLVLLTVIDDFSFPALNPEYMKPLHVTMLLAVAFLIAAALDERLHREDRAPAARAARTGGRFVLVSTIALWTAVASVVGASAALRSMPPARGGAVRPPDRSVLDAHELRALAELAPVAATVSIDGVLVSRDGAWIAQRSDAITVPKGALLDVVGWAADPRTFSPARHLLLLVDAKRRTDVTASYGSGRPDVAAAFGKTAMHYTGFSILVRSAQLGAGTHVLRLGIVRADGKGFYPSKGISIVVK